MNIVNQRTDEFEQTYLLTLIQDDILAALVCRLDLHLNSVQFSLTDKEEAHLFRKRRERDLEDAFSYSAFFDLYD